MTCALSLCAPVQRDPEVHIEGAHGRATLGYTKDQIEVDANGQTRTEVTGRTDLVENLLAYRRDGSALLVPLASTGAFMRVLAAVAEADEPVRIDPRAIRWEGEGQDRRAVVEDIEHWLAKAVSTGRTFTELGAPWAHRERDRVLVRAEIAGAEVAHYLDGRGTIPTSSPRPVPASRPNPGRRRADRTPSGRPRLALRRRHGDSRCERYELLGRRDLRPRRGLRAARQPRRDRRRGTRRAGRRVHPAAELGRARRIGRAAGAAVGQLGGHGRANLEADLRVDAHADGDVTLNSPGSKGRPGGGYGGFFWRFPECARRRGVHREARGGDEVHGSVAPWLAWSADFAAGPGQSGPATIVVAGAEAAAAGEPWFVRVSDYPGLGSALAWDRPVSLQPGDVLSRRFTIAIADGRLTEAQVAGSSADLGSSCATTTSTRCVDRR